MEKSILNDAKKSIEESRQKINVASLEWEETISVYFPSAFLSITDTLKIS